MVPNLKGIANFRLLFLLAALSLVFTTACWAAAVKGPYDGDGDYQAKRDSASGGWASYGSGKSGYGAGVYVAPYDGAQGIHARATGTVSGTPDLAILNLGVESVEDTASEARAAAAEAMDGVMTVLMEAQIEDRDIQTQYFSIHPRYESVRVTECDEDKGGSVGRLGEGENCITRWEQELVGYSVSNQVSVKIRALDQAGTIIDQVTDAAGDLVRVDGISFTIEDIDPLRDEARNEALAKLRQNAEGLAELAGVGLGRLVHLQESTAYVDPFQPVFARVAFGEESAADTSISAGEQDVSVSVSAVYLITEPASE